MNRWWRTRLGNQTYAIRSAAALEAAVLGDAEIEVEHLLLGLLVVDGPSAAVLSGAGLGLADVRRAVREVRGVDVGVPQGAPTVGRPMLPLHARARTLLDTVSFLDDDTGLLLALLDDSRVTRLLDHLGVDVVELRSQALHPALVELSDPRPSALREPAPEGMVWSIAAYARTVPVAADRVWALLSDPTRRVEWDPTCVAVRSAEGDAVRCVHAGGDEVAATLTTPVPGREVVWRDVPSTGLPSLLQIVVTAAPPGARLHLRHHWLVPTRTGRVVRAVLARMMRLRLRVLAQRIAQAA